MEVPSVASWVYPLSRKLLKLGVFLAVLLACGRGGITTPTPPPTTPSPIPTVAPAPSWPWGAIICCDDPRTPFVDEGYRDGWSLATGEALAKLAKAGATLTHFRTGPFADGSASIKELVDAVIAANNLGIKPEIDLIDNWTFIHSEQNLWGDTCEVTQEAPRPRHLAHVRSVVEATKDFNVTYNLGNEGFRCNPVAAWDQGLYFEAKSAGAGSVGTNSGLAIGDYVTTHGFDPTSSGTILTEDDGGDHTPEEWIALYQASKARGGYVMFWRGTMSDAEWQRLLDLMRTQ